MDNKALSPKGPFVLLRLLLPTLLLCGSGGSSSVCPQGAANCEANLKSLFDRANALSNNLFILSSEMFGEFNYRYAWGKDFFSKAIHTCHTNSIPTPENKDQTLRMQHQVLLALIIKVLRSWHDPLKYLAMESRIAPQPTNMILSKATKIDEGNKQLLEHLNNILNQINPEAKKDESYAVWTGIPPVPQTNESNLIFPFFNLLFCLRKDSHKINTILRSLMCRVFHNRQC